MYCTQYKTVAVYLEGMMRMLDEINTECCLYKSSIIVELNTLFAVLFNFQTT